MANYNLVIDTSNFKPFDIGPALLVLHDYRDAYNKYSEQLNKIAEEKGEYVLPDSSPKYKSIMDRYNEDYDAVVTDFSKGMNLLNLLDAINLRRRYHNEIMPIRAMVLNYNKYNDKLTALGPDAIVGNRDRKLEDFYGNVNPKLNYRSNKDILQTAAGVVLGLDNALMSSPEVAGNITQQYFILKQQGLDSQSALSRILKHNPQLNSQEGVSGTSQLIDALDNVYNLYAFEDGTPENSKVWESVVTGAIRGILAPKYSLLTDRSQEIENARVQREYTLAHADYYRKKAALEEEMKNLKLGKVKEEVNGKEVYVYDPKKAKEILLLSATSKSPTATSKVPSKGGFIPANSKSKESDALSISEIDSSTVPFNVKLGHPEGTKYWVGKNAKGEIVGHFYEEYKDVKVNPSSSEDSYSNNNNNNNNNEENDESLGESPDEE